MLRSTFFLSGAAALHFRSDPMKAGTDLDAVKAEYKNATEMGTLHQDGFSSVDCVTDELTLTADKHGVNKLDFDSNTPISIVKYADVAAGNAAAEGAGMTQEKCYNFCRKLEHMKFFGLVNGGGAQGSCYCAPFYRVTAGKNEQCSVPCEGDKTKMCGGTTKSSIFEMHDCEVPEPFDSETTTQFATLASDLQGTYERAKLCSDDVLHFGQEMADAAGKNGNQIGMAHQQDMITSQKQFDAMLKGLPFDSLEVAGELKQALGDYQGAHAKGVALSAATSESLRTKLTQAVEAAEKALPPVAAIADKCQPMLDASLGSMPMGSEPGAAQFYKSASGDLSASCAGEAILPVTLVMGEDTCAEVCRSTVAPTKCVGYQVYSSSENAFVSCHMFSKVTALTKYSVEGCSNGVDGMCSVPVNDETTFGNINKDAHTIDTCFDGEAGSV